MKKIIFTLIIICTTHFLFAQGAYDYIVSLNGDGVNPENLGTYDITFIDNKTLQVRVFLNDDGQKISNVITMGILAPGKQTLEFLPDGQLWTVSSTEPFTSVSIFPQIYRDDGTYLGQEQFYSEDFFSALSHENHQNIPIDGGLSFLLLGGLGFGAYKMKKARS